MKKTFSRSQIEKAISYWQGKVMNESLTASTEAKLKDAAKKFAKWFGEQIKSGQAQRFEDGNYDALVAIKNTIKMNSSAKNMIKFLKSPQAQGVVPTYAIESVAEAGSKAFIANVFDGSKALVSELERAVDVLENYHFEATEDYVQALADAIQDEKDKKLQNLKKSTEQFNYFANCVFGIWRRDPEIAKTLGKIPQLPTDAKDLETLKTEFHEPENQETQEQSSQPKTDDAFREFINSQTPNESEEPEMTEEEFMEGVSEVDEEEKKEDLKEEELKGNFVGTLINVLQKNCQPSDDLLFRINPGKQECFVFDIYSKDGHAVIDLVKGRPFDPTKI